MLREFFLSGTARSVTFAWSGLVAVVLHSLFKAWLKYKLNNWYEKFWDAGGSAVEIGSGDMEGLAAGRQEISQLLLEFGLICIPAVVIHPLFRFFTNMWILTWRLRLVKSYLERWRLDDRKIENGAQRVHEDTQRFAKGLQNFCVVILDSILTLGVFAPILLRLGAQVQPFEAPDSWLLLFSAAVAALGVLGSVLLGWSLVSLEVENQKVEADLRRKLVIIEEDPRSVCDSEERPQPNVEMQEVALSDESNKPPSLQFRKVIKDLRANYTRLYQRFGIFSLWLNSYEQGVVILPYILTAPLLFADVQSNRISLGKVSQLSNAFSNVFSSLNIISDQWIEVTEWLSVLRRLREWEAHIGAAAPVALRSLIRVPARSRTAHVQMTSTH
jgi:peptide/bleomycin uptake transporter